MHIECLGWAWYHTKYLSLVSIDKTGIQNNLGRTGFILFYILCNSRSPQGTKTRTWEQEMKQKPRRTVACWFSPLILYTAHRYFISCPGMAQPTVGWASLHQLAIKKMSNKHAHRPISWGQFLR